MRVTVAASAGVLWALSSGLVSATAGEVGPQLVTSIAEQPAAENVVLRWDMLFDWVSLELLAFVASLVAVRTARQSLEHSRASAETQVRAYLSIQQIAPGINWDDKEKQWRLILNIKNDGATPAHVTLVEGMTAMSDKQPPFEIDVAAPTFSMPSLMVVAPGDGQNACPRIGFAPEQMDAFKAGNRTIWTWGRVAYRDVFEKERGVNFAVWYRMVNGELEWGRAVIGNEAQ